MYTEDKKENIHFCQFSCKCMLDYISSFFLEYYRQVNYLIIMIVVRSVTDTHELYHKNKNNVELSYCD